MFFTKRAAPHEITGIFVISVWKHGEPCIAQGSAVFVNPDGVRDGLRPAAFVVEVNESADFTCFQEFIDRIFVHGGVKAHIFDRDVRHMLFQFMESHKEDYGIMAFGAGKAEQERNIRMKGRVMAGKLEKGIAKIILFQVAVPSPGGVRVRIMAWCSREFVRGK